MKRTSAAGPINLPKQVSPKRPCSECGSSSKLRCDEKKLSLSEDDENRLRTLVMKFFNGGVLESLQFQGVQNQFKQVEEGFLRQAYEDLQSFYSDSNQKK